MWALCPLAGRHAGAFGIQSLTGAACTFLRLPDDNVAPRKMQIGDQTANWLLKLGHAPERVRTLTNDTRLFQDLNFWGDNADDDLMALARLYGVDFSTFPFLKYFPVQFGRDSFILTFFWWTRWGHQVREKYPPITLGMIERTIEQGRWTGWRQLPER